MDSKATRQWAMVPMAMSLSLDTTSFVPNKAARVLPRRMVIHPRQQFVQRKENGDVYVGKCTENTSGKWRPTIKWATPFLEGQHGTKEECLILYGWHLRTSGLISEVWELRSLDLWCECPYSVPCVADVLIAAVYEEWQDSHRVGHSMDRLSEMGHLGALSPSVLRVYKDKGRLTH